MILDKWDYDAGRYLPMEVPDEWNVTISSYDLDEVINCPQCGCELTVGESYTSLEIHTPFFGFGYFVCEKCHKAEVQRNMKNRDE